MKKYVLALFVILSGFILQAQNSQIAGKWLLVKEQSDNEVKQPYYTVVYHSNQLFEVMGMPIGKWDYIKDNNTIKVQSVYGQTIAGESKIEKISENEMTLSKNGTTGYYIKLHQSEINESNAKANFLGTWKIEKGAKGNVKLVFEVPDKLTVITNKKGSERKDACHWIYNPTDNTVIIYGLSHLMRGKHQITQSSENTLALTNNGKTITAVKDN